METQDPPTPTENSNPKLTPITGYRKKGRPPKGSQRPILDANQAAPPVLQPVQDLEIPANLKRKVTPTSLARNNYQRKMLAHFAPIIMPELLNGLRRSLRIGDSRAQKIVADIFGLTPQPKGVSVFVNQDNRTQNAHVNAAARAANAYYNPDEMLRALAEERQKRIEGGPAMIEFTPTPILDIEPAEQQSSE